MAQKTYIGISRDHSGSMSMIARAAARDYNDNVAAIREASTTNNQETLLSVVKCGAGRPAAVVRDIVNANISTVQPLNESKYNADGNSTPLFDSVGELISMFQDTPDYTDPDVSFLVMVITDGCENSSKTWNGRRLGEKMKELQATDRWTFVFRVPRGGTKALAGMGIPEGNILEWEQTERGVQAATTATRAAFSTFYGERATGVKSTSRFYANIADIPLTEVKKSLDDISKEVSMWPVYVADGGTQIRDFCNKHLSGTLVKGCAFYQLTKTEEVQDYKQICIRDKNTGLVYSGAARQMLGLPSFGSVKLTPGNTGIYDVFVQSTSVNRKLVASTSVLYWPGAAV
jgi:hypothetical protein